MATSSNPVLHQYNTRFLVWLMALFFVIGCLLLGLAAGLPLALRPPAEPSLWISIGIAACAGAGLPILGGLLWLLIPAITTTFDASQRALVLEYRRPLGRTMKVYRVDDIADIGPRSAGEHTYSLALVLKTGQAVRLEYSATSDTRQMKAAAARIKAAIGLGTGPRELHL